MSSPSATYDSIVSVILKGWKGDKSDISDLLDANRENVISILAQLSRNLTPAKANKRQKCPTMNDFCPTLPPIPPKSAKLLFEESEEGRNAYNKAVRKLFPAAEMKKGVYVIPKNSGVTGKNGKPITSTNIRGDIWKALGKEQEKWDDALKALKNAHSAACMAWKKNRANAAKVNAYNDAYDIWTKCNKVGDDDTYPKRPDTAFKIYFNVRKTLDKDVKSADCKVDWKDLPDSKKQKYEDRAASLLAAAVAAMTEWLEMKDQELERIGKTFTRPAWYLSAISGKPKKTAAKSSSNDEDAPPESDEEEEEEDDEDE